MFKFSLNQNSLLIYYLIFIFISSQTILKLKKLLKNTTMSDKVKFELEFVIQASPQLLYQYISTPSGLSEWYADNVNSRGEMFTFIWDGAEETAKLLKRKSEEFVKLAWEESEDDSFFEMRIIVDEITKDVSLFIIDFAEDDEVDEAKMLWENQVSDLKQVLGST